MRFKGMNYKSLECDLDGSLTEFSDGLGNIGKLKPGALKVLNKLKAQGFYIIISTARPKHHRSKVRKFLLDNAVPFDEMLCGLKPNVFLRIDDRSIYHSDWNSIYRRIKRALKQTQRYSKRTPKVKLGTNKQSVDNPQTTRRQ